MVTETVFGWPGVARLTVTAVLERDFPLIQGAVLWLAVVFIIANLMVDVTYSPSTRGSGTDEFTTTQAQSRAIHNLLLPTPRLEPTELEGHGSSARSHQIHGRVRRRHRLPVHPRGDLRAGGRSLLPTQGNILERLKPPSTRYIFGTDGLGRDLLSRIFYGARFSAVMGTLAVVASGSLGLLLGALAGYFEGWVDSLVGRFVDTLLAFPGILLAILVLAILGPGSKRHHRRGHLRSADTLEWCAARCCR